MPSTPSGTTSTEPSLCTAEDDYVADSLRWVVTLSGGETVYSDDDRPGLPLGMESAWVRLKTYCTANARSITGMRIQFRSNVVWLPEGKDGYYFSRSAFGVWGDPETFHAYLAGFVDDRVVHVGRWKTPELSFMGNELRQIDPDDPRLILAVKS